MADLRNDSAGVSTGEVLRLDSFFILPTPSLDVAELLSSQSVYLDPFVCRLSTLTANITATNPPPGNAFPQLLFNLEELLIAPEIPRETWTLFKVWIER